MVESSTRVVFPANAQAVGKFESLEQNWAELSQLLPSDFETSAWATGALVRRREVRSALDLLRLILHYALSGLSLRLVAAWFCLLGLGNLSDVALLKRLRKSRVWLGTLIMRLLEQRQLHLARQPGFHIRLLDATVVANPGMQQGSWHVHVNFDLGQMALERLELTDQQSAESLARFPAQPNEIRLADRGYAYAKSLGPSLASGAWHIVRAHWRNLRLTDETGQGVDVLAWLRQCQANSFTAPAERPVQLPTPNGTFRLRLIAAALPPKAAERARRKAQHKASGKGRQASADNLFAAGFIMVLTNLPADRWSASLVLDLYRLRWQVELLFKRLKGLFCLADLRCDDPELAQVYLLGNLLAALLVETMIYGTRGLLPDWFTDLRRPVSLARLTHLFVDQLRQAVHGHISKQRILAALPNLHRYLCDTPRHRVQQLAAARFFIIRPSTC